MTDFPNMSKRLRGIFNRIPLCKSLYDIGTDHAYIPIACLLADRCEKAFALDKREGPLGRAKSNAEKYGLENRIIFGLADGFSGFNPDEKDCSVIAGMGGLEIRKILKKAHPVKGRLILQAQRSEPELRSFLRDKSYKIEKELVVAEDGKFYSILDILHRPGEKIYLTDLELYAGRDLKKRCLTARVKSGKSPEEVETMEEYLNHMIYKTKKRILGDPSLMPLLNELKEEKEKFAGGGDES